MNNLKGKVAFITGGSKGIGYGVAEALLNQGFKVAITSRSLEAAREAAKELESKGEIIGLEADVRNYESQQKAVQSAVDKFGKIDLLVANAGVGKFNSIEDMTPEEWNATIETNLTGVFYSVKSTLSELVKTEGYIVTISSLAGTNYFAGGAAYNASKFGLTGFSQAVMLDLRQKGVKVSTIMPGSVATHFNGHTPSDEDAWKIQKEDIGELVVDLMKMNPRTLPSKIEVRPSQPPKK
ncbi:SDR family oxidoreductase [Zunongwangia profunda]|uniref:Short chain dehydrogenase n=2 Tax=Zunongwangia profunda TaxID=398743 RepID=D5BF41_ZUNPS|nr:SDR family oxidoreductase [Zunongwangia profunda]MAC63676.1 short-chain dehydrogenase [Flavobacteriaceae bacterium]MAS72793.1 short-chain dehydrogenase [Zunongwangia sp.]ADF52939.1 short chain dehydrogenase [Zunongwangia profunda SM-A87]HAJ82328.1 KR domain-containing protein [Zunongwangia profunda]HCV80845.1 KR domain-containing protein [Zunongwangia profunda]|tara:strand:+ start:1006 stop:1719 length:714 start_codon:yes stop_codon:yes gene_type:complete